jgi:alkylhydroperoxidase family enzyme
VAARIAPLTGYGDDLAGVLAKTLASPSGKPFNLFTTLAHHPRLLARFNMLGGLFMAHNELPDRERELVILRVAARTASTYEWGQHVPLARKAGVTEAELRRIAEDGTGWDDADHAVLELTDAMLDGGAVSDELWARLARGHTESQLLELLMLPGFYRMLAGVIDAVGIELDDGLPQWPSTRVACSAPAATVPPQD